MTVPGKTIYSVQSGDTGVVVWAVQKALASLGYQIGADGSYGPTTAANVQEFQRKNSLTADGVAGPKTSAQIATRVCARGENEIPKGLLRGFVEGESGGLIGAVNWSVPGGVDCGYFQRRVYDDKLSDEPTVQRAFDPAYQRDLLGSQLEDRHGAYLYQPAVTGNEQLAWRLAALHHNWPYAAQKISEVGFDGLPDTYWRQEKDWVVAIGARFPDGVAVRTPLEWARFYALGAKPHNHPGLVTKYVTDWEIA